MVTQESLMASRPRRPPSVPEERGESSFVWLTVSVEGRLASDPRQDEPGYIEAVGGRLCFF